MTKGFGDHASVRKKGEDVESGTPWHCGINFPLKGLDLALLRSQDRLAKVCLSEKFGRTREQARLPILTEVV